MNFLPSILFGELEFDLHPHSPPSSPSQTQSQDLAIQSQDGLENPAQVLVSSTPVEPIIPVQVTEAIQHVESEVPEETIPPSSSSVQLDPHCHCLAIIAAAQDEVDSKKKALYDDNFEVKTKDERSLIQLRNAIWKIYSSLSKRNNKSGPRFSRSGIPGWRDKGYGKFSSILRCRSRHDAIHELNLLEDILNILKSVGSELLQELGKGSSSSDAEVVDLQELMVSIKALKLEDLKVLAQSVRHDKKIGLSGGRCLKSHQGRIHLTTIIPRVEGGPNKEADQITLEALIKHLVQAGSIDESLFKRLVQAGLDLKSLGSMMAENDGPGSKDRDGSSSTSSSSDGSSSATIPSGHGAAAAAGTASPPSSGSSSSLPDLEALYDSSSASSASNSSSSSTSPTDDQSSIKRPISVKPSAPVDALSRVANWMANQLGLPSLSGSFNRDLHSSPCDQKKGDGKFATVDEELVVVRDEGLNLRESRKVEEKSGNLGGKESEALRTSLISTVTQDGGNTTVEEEASSINVEAPQVVSSVTSSKVVKTNALSSEASSSTSNSSNDCFFTALIKEIEKLESGSGGQASIDRELLEARTPSSMRSLIQTRLLALRNPFGGDWISFKTWFFSLGTNSENISHLVRQGLFTSGDVDDEAFKKDVDLIGIEGNAVPYYLIPLISFVLGVCLRVRLSFGEVELSIGPVGTYVGVPIGLEISKDREGKGHAISADVCTDTVIHESVFSQVTLPSPPGLPPLESFLRFSQDHHSYPSQLGFSPSLPIGSNGTDEEVDELDQDETEQSPTQYTSAQKGKGRAKDGAEQSNTAAQREVDRGSTGPGADEGDLEGDDRGREPSQEGEEEEEEEFVEEFDEFSDDEDIPALQIVDESSLEQADSLNPIPEGPVQEEGVDPSEETPDKRFFPLPPPPAVGTADPARSAKHARQSRFYAAYDQTGASPSELVEKMVETAVETKEQVKQIMDGRQAQLPTAKPEWDDLTLPEVAASFSQDATPFKDEKFDPPPTESGFWIYLRSIAVRLAWIIPRLKAFVEKEIHLPTKIFTLLLLQVWKEDQKKGRINAATGYVGTTNGSMEKRMEKEIFACLDRTEVACTLILLLHRLAEGEKSKQDPGIIIIEKVVLGVDPKKCAELGLPTEIPLRGLETVLYEYLLPITDPIQFENYDLNHLIALANAMSPNGAPISGSLGMFLPMDRPYFKELESHELPTTPLHFKPKVHVVVPPAKNAQVQAHIPIVYKKKLELMYGKEVDLELELFSANTATADSKGHTAFNSSEILKWLDETFPLDGNHGQHHYFSLDADLQHRSMDLFFQDKINSPRFEVTLSIFAKDGVRTFRPTPSGSLHSSTPGGFLQYSIKNLDNDSVTKFILVRSHGPGNYHWIDHLTPTESADVDAAYLNYSRLSDLSLGWIAMMSMGNLSAPEDGTEPIPVEISASLDWVHEKRVDSSGALPHWRSMHPTATCWSERNTGTNIASAPFPVEFKGHQLGVVLRIKVDPKDMKEEAKVKSEVVFQLKVDEALEEIKLQYNSQAAALEADPFEQIEGWSTIYTWNLKEFIITYHSGLALLVSHSASWSYAFRSPIALSHSAILRLVKFAAHPEALTGIPHNLVPVIRCAFWRGQLTVGYLHSGCSYEVSAQKPTSLEKDDRVNRPLRVAWTQIDHKSGKLTRAVARNCKVFIHVSVVKGYVHLRISPPEDRESNWDVIMKTEEEIKGWKDIAILPTPAIKLKMSLAPLNKNLAASLKYFLKMIPSEFEISTQIKVSDFTVVEDEDLMESFLDENTLRDLATLLKTIDPIVRAGTIKQLVIHAIERIDQLPTQEIQLASRTVSSLASSSASSSQTRLNPGSQEQVPTLASNSTSSP